jgi:CDGSH-type Zn-finger protein
MSNCESIIAAPEPIAVELEAGKKYFWCACGRSKNQPFCDGSHKGTGCEPVAFTAEKSGEAWLCRCKQTGNAPYCDGTHNKLGG